MLSRRAFSMQSSQRLNSTWSSTVQPSSLPTGVTPSRLARYSCTFLITPSLQQLQIPVVQDIPFSFQSRPRESNPLPSTYQVGALPYELRRRVAVGGCRTLTRLLSETW